MARLGIHTYVGDGTKPENTHAWITYTKDGVTRDFALYPSVTCIMTGHHDQVAGWNGNNTTHVREGMDARKTREANDYHEMTPAQEKAFLDFLERDQTYSIKNNNCAHWAVEAWEIGAGKTLDAEHLHRFERESEVIAIVSPIGLQPMLPIKGHDIPEPTLPTAEERQAPQGRFKLVVDRVHRKFGDRDDASDDRKAGREEYRPGSYTPPPKEPGRDRDNKDGRGD